MAILTLIRTGVKPYRLALTNVVLRQISDDDSSDSSEYRRFFSLLHAPKAPDIEFSRMIK